MEMEPSSAETSTAVEDDLSDIFGDQEIFPRVGDEYQADILEETQQSKAETTPTEFLVGLPLTVTCVEKEDWTKTDEAGLLLGLYIFGKDFVKLKGFLGCKTMGSIMAFYYGKFYKSSGYRRWAECRKTKSRKVALGQKIFVGSRLQELLSRLSMHTSEVHQNSLSKVSDLFEEGKMQLDEFVLAIKDIVGMKNFVEAMSIGKGKQDITTLILRKANHTVGKDKSCSSLTPSEIVKLLTGHVRLSKARSIDLFWDAVWPRLLARGWHSEQPNCYAAVSKQSLVFLLPGFKKFSRRGLIKGDHYFDSITDILNKVATEPTLLELEAVESNENHEKKPEPDTNQNSHLLKFTIADTSLTPTNDGKPFITRPLRKLPHESNTRNSWEDSNTSTEDDIKDCSNSTSVSINKHKRKLQVSQQQQTSTDDDINDCLNSTASVDINKHKRKQVSQKEEQQPILPNGYLLEAKKDSSFSVDQSNNESESVPRGLIDLNYPPLPPGFEPCDMFFMEVQNEISAQPVPPPVAVEQANHVNGRRHSTRSRPLTAKALEALADGLLWTGGFKKEKNRAGRCRENSSRSRTNS